MKRRTAPLWPLVFSFSILGCKGTDAQRPAADATRRAPDPTTTPGTMRGRGPGTAAAPGNVQGAAVPGNAPNALPVSGNTTGAAPGNAGNASATSGNATSAGASSNAASAGASGNAAGAGASGSAASVGTLGNAASAGASGGASGSLGGQEVRDFEDQLEAGDADRGPGDPALFARKPGFTPYANGRFRFSLDVPKALVALPGPANGDGLQWHLGNQMSMIASGIHWSTEIEGPLCANSPNVTARKETKTACWATGKRNGFIFWERSVFSRGVLYTLRFQYAESLEATAGPLVTHVNRSWKF